MSGRARWRRTAVGLALAGLASLLHGTWIPLKARLAQILLATAWQRTVVSGEPAKPWPWADTWPVARLRVPRLNVERIVLAGTQGATLAFGPGHLAGSARPGEAGNTVLAGHRDTHFAFLQELKHGDVVWIEAPDRRRSRYRITHLEVVDHRETAALQPSQHAVLTLVTCYPFDALVSGGPLRYVVRADQEP